MGVQSCMPSLLMRIMSAALRILLLLLVMLVLLMAQAEELINRGAQT
jgi:hypothetical protein